MPPDTDNEKVERPTIECLRCGQDRELVESARRSQSTGACPRCQYVGWAYSSELSERTRRLFRDLPLERRLSLRTV